MSGRRKNTSVKPAPTNNVPQRLPIFPVKDNVAPPPPLIAPSDSGKPTDNKPTDSDKEKKSLSEKAAFWLGLAGTIFGIYNIKYGWNKDHREAVEKQQEATWTRMTTAHFCYRLGKQLQEIDMAFEAYPHKIYGAERSAEAILKEKKTTARQTAAALGIDISDYLAAVYDLKQTRSQRIAEITSQQTAISGWVEP